MDVDVDFESVMFSLGLIGKRTTGNYQCPICRAKDKTFKVYPDQKGYCHNKKCQWSGDAIQLYADYNRVSRDEAYAELAPALKDGYIKLKAKNSEFKEQTYAEAKKAFAKDLEFLAWVRIYERFYPDTERRFNRKIFEKKLGRHKTTLSKIINGKMPNALTWRTTLETLRLDLEGPIKELQRKLKLGTKYFEDLIDEEQRGEDVEKLRIKAPKRSGGKIKDKEQRYMLERKTKPLRDAGASDEPSATYIQMICRF